MIEFRNFFTKFIAIIFILADLCLSETFMRTEEQVINKHFDNNGYYYRPQDNFTDIKETKTLEKDGMRIFYIAPEIMCFFDDSKFYNPYFENLNVKLHLKNSTIISRNFYPKDFLMEVKYGFQDASLPFSWSRRYLFNLFEIRTGNDIVKVDIEFNSKVNSTCFVNQINSKVYDVEPTCLTYEKIEVRDSLFNDHIFHICSQCEFPSSSTDSCPCPNNSILTYFNSDPNFMNLGCKQKKEYTNKVFTPINTYSMPIWNLTNSPLVSENYKRMRYETTTCDKPYNIANGRSHNNKNEKTACHCPYEYCDFSLYKDDPKFTNQDYYKIPNLDDLGSIHVKKGVDNFFKTSSIYILAHPSGFLNMGTFDNFRYRISLDNVKKPPKSELFMNEYFHLENFFNYFPPLGDKIWQKSIPGISISPSNLAYYDCESPENERWKCNIKIQVIDAKTSQLYIDASSIIEINNGNFLTKTFGISANPVKYDIKCLNEGNCILNSKFNSYHETCSDPNCSNTEPSNKKFNIGDTACIKNTFYLFDDNDKIDNYKANINSGEMILKSMDGKIISRLDMTDKIKNTNEEKNIYCFPLLLSDTIIVDTDRSQVKNALSMTITFKFDKKQRLLFEKERFLTQKYEIGRPSNLEFEVNESSIKSFYEELKNNNFGNNKDSKFVPEKESNNLMILIISIIAGILLILVIVLFIKTIKKRKVEEEKKQETPKDLQKSKGKLEISIDKDEDNEVNKEKELKNVDIILEEKKENNSKLDKLDYSNIDSKKVNL